MTWLKDWTSGIKDAKNCAGGEHGRKQRWGNMYFVVILVQEIGDHRLVSGEDVLHIGECVTADAKRGRLDVMWKQVKSSPR